MPPILEREVAAGQDGPARQRRWRRWIPFAAVLALVVAAVVAGWPPGSAGSRPVLSPAGPSARSATFIDQAAGVVRVLRSTGQVGGGPSLPEVNGIAEGLGSLWLTGGYAGQNHVLYAVDPVTSRIAARAELPSSLVINPNDVAVGSGAVWVAVGAAVYRIEPASAAAGGTLARAFAALPHGDLVGDMVVDAGAVWVSDTTQGTVDRFAVSTGRLGAVIKVGTAAGAMAAGDGGIWVAGDGGTVSRISVTRNRVDSVRTVPGVPSHLAAGAGGLWVTTGAGGAVAFVSGTSGRAVTVRVGGEPTGVAAIGDTVWVANTADGTLTRIDARRHVVVASVPVGARPYGVAADRSGVWVTMLGRPVTMDTSPAPAPPPPGAALSAWQTWLRLMCGAVPSAAR